jgi:hypothetical protein
MKCKVLQKTFFLFVCQVLLPGYFNMVTAQKIQYCSENVFINNPDHLQLVTNIDGNHHLLSFNNNENPEIFIFDYALEYKGKIKLPFKFPEKSIVKVIPSGKFYYLYIRPWLSQKHLLWKIDAYGNCTDFNFFFQKLLASQSNNIKLGFQLIPYRDHLLMVYHTNLDNIEKNTVVIAETDSVLNVVFTHKVMYDFKRDEEKLEKEILVFGKYLLVLKTARSGTALELMKVNLATSYAISNTFTSSGYFYSQSALSINNEDSSFTVSALLTEPHTGSTPKQYVFVSTLNKLLVEEVPFTILRKQFIKNTGTGFLLVNGQSEWMRFRIRGEQRRNTALDNNIAVYQDLTMPDNNADVIKDINRMLQQTEQGSAAVESWDAYRGIRFSLLDKELNIISDSLVPNTKDYYTLKADQFIHFKVNQREYMLLGQQFAKRSRGLLMVNSNDKQQLIYRDVRVMHRNDYLLSKSQLIPQKGIIIPYLHKLEAGLIKITLE